MAASLGLDGHVLGQVGELQQDAVRHEEVGERVPLQEAGRERWADPQRHRPGETNTEHGGRGVYFLYPAGHHLELTTRPYL